jgi:hypothetical protein
MYKILRKRTELLDIFSFHAQEKALITPLQHVVTDQQKQ